VRVAIVGSGGFIGRALCEALASRGHDAVAISSSADGFDRGTGLLVDLAPVAPLDAMVYLSQSPHYREVPRHAPHLWCVNVVSAIKAAEWAARHGAKRTIYASTGSIYAPSFHAHPETDPVRHDDWYALSKLHAEQALALLPGVEVHSLRLFGVYGPRQRGKLIPNLASRIARGETIELQPHPADSADAGGLRLSLTYVDDAVEAMLHILKDGGPAIMNVAGPDTVSLLEIADALGAGLGREVQYRRATLPRQHDFIADNHLHARLVSGKLTRFADGIIPTVAELNRDAEFA
jgi:UDP-glucose 4-epimerase